MTVARLKIGSLFSGIGGLDIACEQVWGAETAWQIGLDAHALAVRRLRWSNVTQRTDVTTVDPSTLPPVDVLCGGFPCQDVSRSGRMAGLTGERSGLYVHLLRFADALQPQYVVVENVRGLLKYKAQLDADFAAIGYGTRWTTTTAKSVGAPHERERVFILATRGASPRFELSDPPRRTRSADLWSTPSASDDRSRGNSLSPAIARRIAHGGRQINLSMQVPGRINPEWVEVLMGFPVGWTDLAHPGVEWHQPTWPARKGHPQHTSEPPRVMPGTIKGRPARLKALGNAVVPAQGIAAINLLLEQDR